MSVLRNLEAKLAGLVEGTFSRAFKSEVRPVEIARKLAREMEEHKVASLSRTYVPNEYAVWLSPDDREQFEGYEDELRSELSGYLLEHARRERVALLTAPRSSFRTDERLRLGEFGIQARLVRPAEDAVARRRARARRATRWSTRPPSGSREPLREPDHAPRRGAGCASTGATACSAPAAPCSAARASATSCSTTRTSRASTPRSARRGGSWTVRDLGSTNGVKVNGRRIDGAQSLQARRQRSSSARPPSPSTTVRLRAAH